MRRLLALGVALAVLAGCAGVPDGGAPVAVPNRKLEQGEPVVNAELVGPQVGGTPAETVGLFIEAARISRNRDELGRAFLTSQAQDVWKRPALEVVLYQRTGTEVTAEADDTATVKLTGSVRGTVNDVGIYRPESRQHNITIELVKRGGSWLIESVPPGVLVLNENFQDAFQPVPVYFVGLSADGGTGADDVLVPELRFMDKSLLEPGLLTPIVRALLAGPSPWLQPATRSPLPKNTVLRSNVTRQSPDSDVVVDLSPDVESAKPADLNAFAAQVAWSLDPYFQRNVRLLVNGQQLAVSGVDAVQGREHWYRYNAVDGAAPSLYYVSRGRLQRFTSGGLQRSDERDGEREPVPGGTHANSGVLTAAISTDGRGVALVKQAPGDRQALWIGSSDGDDLRQVVSGRTISRPTFGHGHDAVLVAVDGVLHEVTLNGALRKVAFPQDGVIAPIRSIRLAPDGRRLAVVAGDGAAARAYVGLIQPAGAGRQPALVSVRQVPVPIAQIQDIGWREDSPTTVTVAGQGADGAVLVRDVSVDGAVVTDSARTGLPQGAVTLATAPISNSAPYVETGRQLYQGGRSTWSPQEASDVRSPFYPG